jgi:two-component system cell cycle sensor histidine kinase/response regulator CckA
MIRSRVLIWLVPIVLPLGALAIQLVLWQYVQPGIWFFFFPAVFVSAWLGGIRMAVPAGALSAVLARYYFMAPSRSLDVSSPNHLFPLLAFIAAAALLGFMRDRMRHAQENASHRDRDLSLMFNTMNEGVALNECVFDSNGEMIDYRILRVNHAFYSTADYQGKKVVGSLATELYGMSARSIREFWLHHRHVSTVQQSEFQSPISGKYYIISTSPFVRGHFVTSFFDITARKQTIEALRAREMDLARSQAIAHLGSYRLNLADDELEWSDECKEIWGVKTIPPLNDLVARIHPEDRDLVAQAVRGVREEGRSFRIDYRIFMPDGSMRYLRDQAEVLRSPEGEPAALYGTVLDVTELREAADALRQSESRFRVLVESINDLVYTMDENGRYSAIFGSLGKTGLKAEDLLGKTARDIYRDAASPHEAAIERALRGEYVVYEWQWPGPTGLLHFQTSLSAIRTESRITGIVGVGRDITQQKSIEESAERGARIESLAALAGGIAHDFNNLLAGIYGHIELAAAASTESRVAALLGRATSSIERARKLTGQLLTFARGGAPDLRSRRVLPLAEEVLSFALAGSGMRLEAYSQPGLWPAVFDPSQLSQVLENLAINAKHATASRGSLQLDAENVSVQTGEIAGLVAGDYVRLSVRDSGQGIEPENLAHIFEPFFTTRAEGNGLGLATAYSIVKRHGGAITVDSVPGKGATFRVYLPRGGEPEEQQLAAGAAAIAQRKCRILVMDDQEDLRDLISEGLRLMGHEPLAVSDGETALASYHRAKTKDAPFDAAILDLTIPGGMGGAEVAREIRKHDAKIPIFIVSGYANDRDEMLLAESGISGALQKPFTIEQLTQMLRTHLG